MQLHIVNWTHQYEQDRLEEVERRAANVIKGIGTSKKLETTENYIWCR